MARERRKGGAGGKLLCFFLGILMGIIFVVGALAGVGYYAYKKPIGKSVKLIDKVVPQDLYDLVFTGEDAILNEKYAELGLGDMVKELQDIASGIQENTLEGLCEISPMMKKKVEDLVDELVDAASEYGITTITAQTLMEKPIGELADYIKTEAMNLQVGGLLNNFIDLTKDGNELLLALFYGEEGKDYEIKNGEIVTLDGASVPTIDSIVNGEGGMMALVENVALDAVGLSTEDAVTRALVCGPSNRYDLQENKPVMKQQQYAYDSATGKLYDIDGKEVEGFAANSTPSVSGGTLTTSDGETLYLSSTKMARSGAAPLILYAYSDAEYTKEVTYPKTTIGDLMKHASDIINTLALGDALGLGEPFTEEDAPSSVLLALSYGSEGVDYTIDDLGNGTKQVNPITTPRTIEQIKGAEFINNIQLADILTVNPNDSAVLLYLVYGEGYELVQAKDDNGNDMVDYNGNPVYERVDPKDGEGNKLGDLLEGANTLLNDLPLKDALGVTADSNPILLYLAYGVEGTDYTIENGEIIPTPDGEGPKTLGNLTSGSDELINDMPLHSVLNVTANSSAILRYLAYGVEGEDYELVQATDEYDRPLTDPITGERIMEIQMQGENTPHTLANLTSGADTLINEMPLKDALGVTAASHPIIIALAYGNGYEIDGDTITGGNATTLGDLTGDGSTKIINGLYLKDALSITATSPSILISLAYGVEHVDYELVANDDEGNPYVDKDGNPVQKFKMINGSTPRTLQNLSGDTNTIINSIYLKDALTINSDSHAILKALAYVDEDETQPRTLGELSANSATLIDGISLTDVLQPAPDNQLIMFLLYGRKGVHYELTGEGEHQTVTMLPKRILVLGSTVYNEYGETLENYSVSGTTLTIPLGEGESITKSLKKQSSTQTIGAGDAEVYYILKDAAITTGDDIYVLYKSTTLGDMSGENSVVGNLTTRITISEILGNVDDNPLLESLANTTIANLPNAISDLKVSDVFTTDELSKNAFLKHLSGCKLTALPSAITNLTIQQVFGKDIYKQATEENIDKGVSIGDYIDGSGDKICSKDEFESKYESEKNRFVLTGTWKYLLTAADDTTPDYKITEMASLVTNMQRNMTNATLSELNDDGIISIANTNNLNTKLITDFGMNKLSFTPSKNPDGSEKTTIGELTISELFNYVFAILDIFSSTPST